MYDKPTEDSKTEDKKTVSLTFTSEDTKLRVITFAGTVAANIVVRPNEASQVRQRAQLAEDGQSKAWGP